MARFLKISGLFLAVIIVAVAAWTYENIRSLDVTKVTDDVYMLSGLGGNVAVLKTDEGAVIVDSMTLPYQGRNIAKKAAELTGQPVIAVINTHYHADHTHGNPGFEGRVRIISNSRTHEHLVNLDGDHWLGDKSQFLPTEFVDDGRTLSFGNKSVRLVSTGPAHTDGDLVVLFVEDRVVHTGDIFFGGFYPKIDIVGGGSVQQWPAALDEVLRLPFDKVIPGHGPISDAAGLVQLRKFMVELGAYARDAVARGLGRAAAIAGADFTQDADMTAFGIPLVFRFDRESTVGEAWDELNLR